jgi:hypothetical protein
MNKLNEAIDQVEEVRYAIVDGSLHLGFISPYFHSYHYIQVAKEYYQVHSSSNIFHRLCEGLKEIENFLDHVD